MFIVLEYCCILNFLNIMRKSYKKISDKCNLRYQVCRVKSINGIISIRMTILTYDFIWDIIKILSSKEIREIRRAILVIHHLSHNASIVEDGCVAIMHHVSIEMGRRWAVVQISGVLLFWIVVKLWMTEMSGSDKIVIDLGCKVSVMANLGIWAMIFPTLTACAWLWLQ